MAVMVYEVNRDQKFNQQIVKEKKEKVPEPVVLEESESSEETPKVEQVVEKEESESDEEPQYKIDKTPIQAKPEESSEEEEDSSDMEVEDAPQKTEESDSEDDSDDEEENVVGNVQKNLQENDEDETDEFEEESDEEEGTPAVGNIFQDDEERSEEEKVMTKILMCPTVRGCRLEVVEEDSEGVSEEILTVFVEALEEVKDVDSVAKLASFSELLTLAEENQQLDYLQDQQLGAN
ncbi:glutamic acid-rich protein-like [Octopus sinensis]|uniref:Glutamic acid-rich protein-like n=1 Tax=Octopus sinensis TaxID=2607531 RepID=A0A6P7TYU6_9MOLL|nr:glutamic acid-rich protein-like [Octopus sinensis]